MTHSPASWTLSGDLIVGAPEPRPNPKVEPHPHAVAKLCWDFDGDAGANGDLPWSIAKANGRLIIAAPDLLQALLLFVEQYQGNGFDERELRPEMKAARAAIAKAQGLDQ